MDTRGCPYHAGPDDAPAPAGGKKGSPGHSAAPLSAPTLEGEGDTDYERYMNIPALLRLQKKEGELGHHDELLFQTIHQAFELWNKLWLFELAHLSKLVDDDDVVGALPILDRMRLILETNTGALSTLDTMTPKDFHAIRVLLGQGSGAESPGFRQIQQTAPKLWPRIEAMVQRRGLDLPTVYLEQEEDPILLRFLERLMDVDQAFHVWRLRHLALVKRIIGRDVKSLKGYSVHQLEQDVGIQLWPKLWKVREHVTEVMGTSPE